MKRWFPLVKEKNVGRWSATRLGALSVAGFSTDVWFWVVWVLLYSWAAFLHQPVPSDQGICCLTITKVHNRVRTGVRKQEHSSTCCNRQSRYCYGNYWKDFVVDLASQSTVV